MTKQELEATLDRVLSMLDQCVWSTRNAAENSYCLFCCDLFGDKYRWDDQEVHHPECPAEKLLKPWRERSKRRGR